MTASVIQVVSPELRTISRRTSCRSFDSSSANFTSPPPNLNAFFMPGVAALSAGPPSSESRPRTRSGRATASRNAIAAPLLWATNSAPRDAEAVEHLAHPAGLRGERVVRVLRDATTSRSRAARRRWCGSRAAASGAGEHAVAVGGAEDAGNEDERLAGADRGGAKDLAGATWMSRTTAASGGRVSDAGADTATRAKARDSNGAPGERGMPVMMSVGIGLARTQRGSTVERPGGTRSADREPEGTQKLMLGTWLREPGLNAGTCRFGPRFVRLTVPRSR